jgi:hypothetical protein
MYENMQDQLAVFSRQLSVGSRQPSVGSRQLAVTLARSVSERNQNCSHDTGILNGERDPQALVRYADGRIKTPKKILLKALHGNWREEQLFNLKVAWEHRQFLLQQLEQCAYCLPTCPYFPGLFSLKFEHFEPVFYPGAPLFS